MQVFDASSIIHAWDHYPQRQFPAVWEWLASEAANKKIGISEVALGEVEKRSPECYDWLRAENITCVKMTNEAVKKAAEIKSLLGIVNER